MLSKEEQFYLWPLMVKINLLIARMKRRIMIPMTAIAARTAAAMIGIGPVGVGEVMEGSGSEQEVNG